MESAFFVLHGALEYAAMGHRGARLYRFKKGKPLEVRVPQDIVKFRRQPDLFFEADAEGNPFDPAATSGAAARPRSFRAFRQPVAARVEPMRAPAEVATPSPAVAAGDGLPSPQLERTAEQVAAPVAGADAKAPVADPNPGAGEQPQMAPASVSPDSPSARPEPPAANESQRRRRGRR